MNQGPKRRYKPGQFVPRSGIYRVYHAPHRLLHEAALLESTRFPRCKTCGNSVRFVLARPAHTKDVIPFRGTFLLEEWQEKKKAAAS